MNLLFWFIYHTLDYPFRVFFRRIYIHGLEHIPKDKPVLIASNHSNSFLDGVVVQKILRRRLYIFVRGDVFKHPMANKLLRQIRLFPIFRMRDAGNDARLAGTKNKESIDEAYGYFQKNYAVLIFSEAAASMAKTLLPIKKGTANIALDLEDRSGKNLDLHIVPAGVNYTFFKGLRKDIMVQFGAPLRVQDYLSDWKEDSVGAVHKLTSELETRMREQVVCIDQDQFLAEAELLLEAARNEVKHPFFLQKRKSPERFTAEKSASEFVNYVFKDENRETEASKAAFAYIDLLRDLNIRDVALAPGKYLWMKVCLIFLFLIPAFTGFLANGLSWFVAYKLANRLTRDPAFYDSIHLGLAWFLSVLFSLCLLIISAVIVGPLWAFALLAMVLFSAYFSIWWFDMAKELLARLKVWQLGIQDAKLLQRMQQTRKYLLAEMDQF